MTLSRAPHLVFLAVALCLLALTVAASGWLILLVPAAFLTIAVASGASVRGHTVAFWIMMVSTAIAAAAMAFFNWVFVAVVDAADYHQPEPAGTQFGGAALIVFAVCFVIALVAGVRILTPARRD